MRGIRVSLLIVLALNNDDITRPECRHQDLLDVRRSIEYGAMAPPAERSTTAEYYVQIKNALTSVAAIRAASQRRGLSMTHSEWSRASDVCLHYRRRLARPRC